MSTDRLTDKEIDAALMCSVSGYDPDERYPEWGNESMREAYRAGYEDRGAATNP